MANQTNQWDNKIQRAVEEIETRREGRGDSSGIQLPTWLPYLVFVFLGIAIANLYMSGHSYHPESVPSEFETGGKVALLMMAEDIEHHRLTQGKLPEEIPGSLPNILDIEYVKLSEEEFMLRMDHYNARIRVGNGRESLDIEKL